jgi:hypothetical protein
MLLYVKVMEECMDGRDVNYILNTVYCHHSVHWILSHSFAMYAVMCVCACIFVILVSMVTIYMDLRWLCEVCVRNSEDNG